MRRRPFGWLALLGTARGLLRVSLQPEPQQALDGLGKTMHGAEEHPEAFADALAAFSEYFGGNVTAPWTRSHWISPTPRHSSVRHGLPAGAYRRARPASYQWLAEAAGNPRASRAAGQAMARNPFPLIIPCHRVVGSNGGLHGYGAGGVGVNARLLEMERNRGTLL